jgi:hypothetical protein
VTRLTKKSFNIFMINAFVGSVALTIAGACIAVASMGAGHGDYFWVKVIFPSVMLSTVIFGFIPIPLLVLALFQFPAYAFLMGFAYSQHRLWMGLGMILSIHLVAVLLCFAIRMPNFGG